MKHEPIIAGKRRPTNVSLPAETVAKAKELGINISKACEAGLIAATRSEQERRFREENVAAFDYWNHWVEEHGLPLEKYRLF